LATIFLIFFEKEIVYMRSFTMRNNCCCDDTEIISCVINDLQYDSLPKLNVIPKVLHLICLGGNLPEKQAQQVQHIESYHSGWEVIIWDDNKIVEFTYNK
jgi:hypothetical protein